MQTVDNQAQANNALQRIKRDVADPFDYLKQARKPNKQAKAQEQRKGKSQCSR